MILIIKNCKKKHRSALSSVFFILLVKCFCIPDYAFGYNILWNQHNFLEGLQDNGYMVATFVQKEYETIYQKNLAGEEISKEDFEYLREMKAAFDKLHDTLTDENNSLNKNAINSEYFAECFNEFSERMYRP